MVEYKPSQKEIELLLKHDEKTYDKIRAQFVNPLCLFIYDEFEVTLDVAKELANDSFIKAVYLKIHYFNPKKSSFCTWLFNVAKHYTIDYLRTSKDTPIPSSDVIEIEGKTDKPSQINLILQDIKEILTEEEYYCLVHNILYRETMEEIANDRNIPKTTVANRVRTAKIKIREQRKNVL